MIQSEISKKKIYIWNTLGGIVNSGLSIIAIMLINRISNQYSAGLFSLGFANAMLLQHVGSFDSRSLQCADARNRFKFSDYFIFRLITCMLMVISTIAFIILNQYDWQRALITILLVGFCFFTNISDIFQGLAQKYERLDTSGQSMVLRTVGGLFLFGLILSGTKNIFWSSLGLILAQIVVIVLFDIPRTRNFEKATLQFDKNNIRMLFKLTLPLFLSLFLQVYIYNMPKYAIDKYLSMEMQNVYAILFMPASVISLCGNFIFRPVLTRLSQLWSQGEYENVIRMSIKRILVLLVLTVILAFGAYFVGPPLLSIFYGTDVRPYSTVLVVIMIGGGFSGISTLLYFMAAAVGSQYKMLGCYIFAFLASMITSPFLVQSIGLLGAAFSYLLACVILNLQMILMIRRVFKKSIESTKKEEG